MQSIDFWPSFWTESCSIFPIQTVEFNQWIFCENYSESGWLKSSKVPVSKSDRVAPQGSEINIWKRRKEYRSWMSENLFRFYCPLKIIALLVFNAGQFLSFYHKIVKYTMCNKKLLMVYKKYSASWVLNQPQLFSTRIPWGYLMFSFYFTNHWFTC